MAFIHSPKIVTDGLVVLLDARNIRCYSSGSTTVRNLVSDTIGQLGSASYSSTIPLAPIWNGIEFTFSSSATVGNGETGGFIRLNDITSGATYPSCSIGGWFSVAQTSSTLWTPLTFIQESDNGGTYLGLMVNTSGSVTALRRMGFGIESFVTGSYIVTSNQYFNAHVNYPTINSVELYVNGQLQYSGSATTVNTTGSANDLIIGATRTAGPNPWPFFTGSISQVHVYNRRLTELEIQQNFNAMRGRYGV